MKVLYITSTWFADGDLPLVKNMIEQGVEVHLCIKVYTNALKSTIFDLKASYNHLGIFDSSIYGQEIDRFKPYTGLNKITIINHTGSDNSLINLKLLRDESKLIKTIKPDIIHYIGWPSLYEYPLLLKYGRKTIVTVHDPLPHVKNIKARVYRVLRSVVSGSIFSYILLNRNQTEAFSHYYKIPTNKIKYSNLGNYDVIKMFVEKKEYNNNEKSILFFGRVSPYKGIEYLLEAFTQLCQYYPTTKLIVAGGGTYYFDINKYKQNPQIVFVNEYVSTEKLATLINNSLFVVCPYVTATQSGVVASAFALGKPIIATRVGGLPEMIDDGKTGLLIKERDVESLIHSMKTLLDNKKLLEDLSSNIIRESNFGLCSWKNIAANTISIYNNSIS